jgi:hypothetical protein
MKLETPQPSDFDPYYRWLGIPKRHRPPNHYQLLGISPKEDDHEIIESAVERQTNLVKTQKDAEHEHIATRILYEIQEAGMVVLDSYRRKEYDASLAQSKSAPAQRLVAEPLPPHTPFKPVGEGNEIVRTYFGVMSVILGGFIIMAAVSFYLPWQKVVFNRPEKAEQDNLQNVQAANAQAANVAQVQPPQLAAKGGDMAAAPKESAAAKQDDVPDEPVELATIEAKITAVDAPGRSITLSRNSKTVALDVSRVAKITVDGVDTTLDALHPGQIANIEFDPQHDVAVKIEATSTAEKTVTAKQEATPAADDAGKEQKGALATVDVTIQKVDAEGRQLTVTRKSKTTVFDVSRKAEVMVGGKAAALESMRPGQKATITFDPENEVVVRVEAEHTTKESPTAPTTPKPPTQEAGTSDELTTVEATIASVDTDKRSVSITRKSKTTAFDVSRKAEIVVNGKAATLDSLKSGQKVTVTINTKVETIVKIVVGTSEPATPK